MQNRQIIAERYTRSFLQRIFHLIEQTNLFQRLKQYSNQYYSNNYYYYSNHYYTSFIRRFVDKFYDDSVVYDISDRIDRFIQRRRYSADTKERNLIILLWKVLKTLFIEIYKTLRKMYILLLNKFI